jgi:hypothetical protein
LTGEFQSVEKEGKHTTEESKTKLMIEVKIFEEKMYMDCDSERTIW